MKKERNELLEFLGGLVMLIVGLYLFTNKVTVQSTIFYGSFAFAGVNVNSGLVVIPFIIGVVLLFIRPNSFISKFVTGAGLVIIVASVIASTTIRVPRISLYEWLLYLILIFGGAGLVCTALFSAHKSDDEKKMDGKK